MKNSIRSTRSTPKNLFSVSTENNHLRIYMATITGNNYYSKVFREIGQALCGLDGSSEVVIQVTNTIKETDSLASTLSRLANEIKCSEHRVENH